MEPSAGSSVPVRRRRGWRQTDLAREPAIHPPNTHAEPCQAIASGPLAACSRLHGGEPHDPGMAHDEAPEEQPQGTGSAADFLPPEPTLERMADAVQGCRGCGLYARATQAVFGAGTTAARVMLLGEQPGDKEDVAGAPFVGPAGKLLDTALESAGIDRRLAYVTNVVKHFKWKEPRPGVKRRLHDRPNASEITACRPWLEHEIAQVRPAILVCLGATAAQAILGKTFRVSRDRGSFFVMDLGPLVFATIHPSAILRSDDRASEMSAFIADLRLVADKLAELEGAVLPDG
jgi:DNA polymerase